jgi:DUF1680 family protein
MEAGIYNSGMSGFGLDGFSFFYNNPLRRYISEEGLAGWNETYERSPHIGCYCCPPQLARHIAGFRHYLYSVSSDQPELWINFFASSNVETTLSDGTTVSLDQRTDYPWNGAVSLTVELDKPAKFSLQIPIPSWADGATATVNGKEIGSVVAGEFLTIDRRWKSSDEVQIELPMRIRVMKANPLLEQALNQVAVVRGPVVYCLESVDLPEDIFFMDVHLKRDGKYTAEYREDLLDGVVVIKTDAVVVDNGAWSEKSYNSPSLYREVGEETTREIPVQLIPYHTWSNRGKSEMTIWMPVL